MSFRNLLNKSAIPYTRTDGALDEYGHPTVSYTPGAAIPCSLQVAKSMGYRRQERPNPNEGYPMWVEWEFYFEYGVPLRERDRFEVEGTTVEIDLIMGDASGRNHHLEGQGHTVRPG